MWPIARTMLLMLLISAGAADAQSLRFRGHGGSLGENFVFPDRVKVLSEPPAAVNVGAGDFTIEFFMRASAADNGNGGFSCGFGIDWVNSNIMIDRDRFGQSRKIGIGLLDGAIAFGASDDLVDYTLCGSATVTDELWHHVAVERRSSDGRLRIWVDGVLDTEGPVSGGPTGDMRIPIGSVSGNFCSPDGGSGSSSCENSDPFLVFGAEKHGFSGINYSGWLDEIHLSETLRYTTTFTPASEPFVPDVNTAALYHFDEGAGTLAADASAGSSDGEVFFGGAAPPGPEWSSDSPFAPKAVPGVGPWGWTLLTGLLLSCAAVARSRRGVAFATDSDRRK